MTHVEPWQLALAVLGFLLTAGGMLIAVGRFVGRIERVWEEMRDAMKKWEVDREKLAQIPLLQRDLDTVKDTLKTATSRIEELWRKVFSHDKHIAVLRSSQHDISDTEPPEAG